MKSGSELIDQISNQLNVDKSVSNYEARVILESVTGDKFSEIVLNGYDLNQRQQQSIAEIVQQRNSGKPLAYVLKSAPFRNLDLFVDERVLIPRSETELVVQYAIDCLKAISGESKVLDLCTGSGAIALSIASEVKESNLIATDISEDALAVARLNAIGIGTASRRVSFLQGDLFDALDQSDENSFDLIITNPPYIGLDEKDSLENSVLMYEPELALFAGEQGDSIYRQILDGFQEWLKPNGRLILEIAPRHVEWLKEFVKLNEMDLEIKCDFNQRERIAIVTTKI